MLTDDEKLGDDCVNENLVSEQWTRDNKLQIARCGASLRLIQELGDFLGIRENRP